MNSRDYIKVWYSDYGDIFLKRIDTRLMLKRYSSVDYDYMQEYIDNNCDLLSEWQEDVYHWNTEDWYDEWRQDYEYRYEDYFAYDSDTDEYYDEDSDDITWDWFYTDGFNKEDFIERVMDCFYENYQQWNFEWADVNEDRLREIIWKYYDDCITYKGELEERNKPHWKVFNYYK